VPLVNESHGQQYAHSANTTSSLPAQNPAPAQPANEPMGGGMKAAIAFAVVGLVTLAGAIGWILVQK
jgi:hypothetical protein